jgi:lysine-arginine-ornithine-binding protein
VQAAPRLIEWCGQGAFQTRRQAMTSTRFNLIAAAIVATAGFAAATTMAAAETVRVATEASFPPFSKTEADGSFSGFEIDLGNAVCERAGLECEWVKQDFDGMIAALIAGKYDFVFSSMSITEEREKVVDFSIPYYDTPSKFAARKGSGIDLDALDGKTVGVYAGSIQDDYIQREYPGVEIRGYDNIDQIASDLVASRIDLMFVEGTAAQEFFDTEEGANYEFLGPDIFHEESPGAGAMFRKGEDEELRERINEAIREVYADGTIDEIAAKHFTISIRADDSW